MKKHTILIALAAVAVAGCSADVTETVAESPTASATASVAAPASQTPGILDALAAAGATCSPGERGEQECVLDGIEVAVAVDGWERQAADRARACEEGWINPEFQLLTDGVWTATVEHHDDLPTVRDVVGGEVRPYCP